MQKRFVGGVCSLVLGLLAAGTPLKAQSESARKPPMYAYISQWAVPRAQWGEMAKIDEQDKALEDKLLAAGTITAYGTLVNLIHTEGNATHADFFWATSEGNILKALAAFYARPDTTSSVFAASKHADHFVVTRIHNARSGNYEGGYLEGSMWIVKPGQMQALIAILKSTFVPILEKELAAGNVIFYSVETQDYHTEDPGTVIAVFAVPDASAVDKLDAAFESALEKDNEIGPAFGALTKRDSHRDFLYRVTSLVIK